MGGSNSTVKYVTSCFEDKTVPFEKILLRKLVKRLPIIIQDVNNSKLDYANYCRNHLIPRRQETIKNLKEIISQNRRKNNFQYWQISVISNFMKFVLFICAALSIIPLKILTVLFVAILTVDFKMHCSLFFDNKDKVSNLRLLISLTQSDSRNLQTAKYLWSEFKENFENLQQEVGDFVDNVQRRYLDVCCADEMIKKFLKKVVYLKCSDKYNTDKFFEAFAELIEKYGLKLELDECETENDSSKVAFRKYTDTCYGTLQGIEAFLRDSEICFLDFDVSDITSVVMSVMIGDVQFIENIKNEIIKLETENTSLSRKISNVKQNNKTKVKSSMGHF